jgi:hypothetical protein
MRSIPAAETELRLKLQAAEHDLREARALIVELHDQMTCANEAAVRVARRWLDSRRAAA